MTSINAPAPPAALQDFNQVGRHPDVDLAEPRLNLLLERREEFAVLRDIRDVDKHADQVIAVDLPLMMPRPADRLGFTRHGPNCCLRSNSVSPISSSGTGWPSLNRSGRRISNRRNV